MNIKSARNVKEFVHVLKMDGAGRPIKNDDAGRPTRFYVPGHEKRHYEVSFSRNKHLSAYCFRQDDDSGDACHGNSHAVCYHVRAACLVAAEVQGKELSWCNDQADAERLARVGGETFSVKSAQSGMSAWGVMRETKPDLATAISTYERMAGSLLIGQGNKSELELAAAGLSKNELVKLAIEKASDKQQWYSGESLWLAEDAFLSNDSGFVRLYQTYPDEKYPKYPQSRSLAIVFWLDPKAGCWRRYTADRAMSELFDDHDSAIPVQRTRGRNKLFK